MRSAGIPMGIWQWIFILKKNEDENRMGQIYFIVFIGLLGIITAAIYFSITVAIPVFLVVLAVFIPIWMLWKIYEWLYYNSKKFKRLKKRVCAYINDCNDLNHHIEQLKETSFISNKAAPGYVVYSENNAWKTRPTALSDLEQAPHIHYCSRSVCDGARRDPFKYICKYFEIPVDEDSLRQFEKILNNFETVEEGRISAAKEKESIIKGIKKDIPPLILTFGLKTFEKQIGFEKVDLSNSHFSKYTFKYISPAGYKTATYDIVMDLDNLNKFILYLAQKIKFKKSVAGQRALMTSDLRKRIKERDHYTCQMCGISVEKEPHLLLEIDHIIPLSRGGMTTEYNLQTLCWRCNRKKGAKLQ